jgi:hypothetical protein
LKRKGVIRLVPRLFPAALDRYRAALPTMSLHSLKLRRDKQVKSLRGKKRSHGDVFIDIVPVDSDPPPDEAPVRALFRRRAKKAREPRQRSGNAATVDECDNYLVIGAFNIDSVSHWLTG